VDVLRKNYSVPRVPPQKEFRAELEAVSSEELHKRLESYDPEAAQKMSPQNKNRIIRALEVIHVTGKKISDLQETNAPLFDFLLLGVWMDPELLEKRIHLRTEELWNAGFLNEVQSLMKQGFTEETPAMIAHGYREAMRFLKGEITEKEAKNLMERNTRRYAKRQRTWWRREKEMVWVSQ
jgi:tRNA dimethylallyltransferase